MKKVVRLPHLLIFILITFFSFSCGKDKTATDEHILDKPVEVGKVTNLKSYSGRNRVKLSWKSPSNTSVKKYSIKWGNGAQQFKDVFPSNDSANDYEIILDQLAESNYVFSITTVDNMNNISAPVSVNGRTYGVIYEKEIVNRKIKNTTYENGTLIINWENALAEEQDLEIKYVNASDVQQVLKITKSDNQTALLNYKSGSAFDYKTTFQPIGSIDLFYTEYASITPEISAPKLPYLGADWVLYSPVKKIHLDDDEGLKTSAWMAYRSACSPVICADYRYDSSTLTETFQILNTKSNRSEIRIEDNYSTGSRQFTGYVKFDAPLNDESLMQIFGSTSSNATQLMIRGYAENGGTLKISNSFVLATGVYNKEVQINVIHLQGDVGGKMIVYIDGVKKFEKVDDENATNYMKYGCYGTMKTGKAVVQWRDVKLYRNGKAPL